MSTAIPLSPVQTAVGDAEFQSILTWQFAQHPFYEAQVQRLLKHDVPHRMAYGACSIWVYRDPHGNIVGFGTLDVCSEYSQFTGGDRHCYIPVLTVNPAFQRRGHGRTITEHLVAEAVLAWQMSADVSDPLFLDVYGANRGAISLYEKCGFATLNPNNPIPDPTENNEPYLIMAKRISLPAP
jgi:ribosomal protein S18 acetylase RimI-like enzyme